MKYALSANFITLAISVILNIFVPKYLGVREYSYWQLYVFYSSYGALFHFGWLDGIYLKIGGKDYDELDKRMLGNQFWYLIFFELLMSGVFLFILFISNIGQVKKTILLFTILVTIVILIKTYLMYIFQSTNRIKEYAQIARTDRYVYAFFVILFVFSGGNNYIYLIILDILSKLMIIIWGIYKIRDIVVTPLFNFYVIKDEVIDNIKIGSSLMLGNYAGMFIIGIVRFFVEKRWSIEVFGKLSFTLSISNMFMMFINAAGVVMFPLLRRTNEKKLPLLYLNLRRIFVPISFFLMFFFFPIKFILIKWLPEYYDSLNFMGLLFPMIIYEGRTSLLVSTYLKTLRKERIIMITNLITIIISFALSIVTTLVLKNLNLTVLIIMFCLMIRCVLAELLLCKIFLINLKISLIYELLLTIVFVFCNSYVSSFYSFFLYLLAYLIYFIHFFRFFKSSASFLKKAMT